MAITKGAIPSFGLWDTFRAGSLAILVIHQLVPVLGPDPRQEKMMETGELRFQLQLSTANRPSESDSPFGQSLSEPMDLLTKETIT